MFGSGGPESIYASQTTPKENNGLVGGKTTLTASSHIMVLFVDCEIVHE